MTDDNIRAYCAERDEAILGGLETFTHFTQRKGIKFSSPHIAEITFHKCRYNTNCASDEQRELSRLWLLSRGFSITI